MLPIGEKTLDGSQSPLWFWNDKLENKELVRQLELKTQILPGTDHLGKGIGSLDAKYGACAAHSYGKERTAVEVFAGCGWDMTFDEYIRMISWMFQQGMQVIINHGFFYSDRDTRKNDWPPSQFFQWQGWNRMKEGNAMTRRVLYTNNQRNRCQLE